MDASSAYSQTGDRALSRGLKLHRIALVMGIMIAAWLLLYRLADYPTPWYDEGSHLHVAKNYALNGIYADFSSDGIRYYGPAIGVGPTVMLPVAAAFRAFGVSIPLARLVIVVYGLLALVALYTLGRRLLSPWGALAAVALVLVSPGADFVFNARTVLGEVPGLFFTALGLWLWLGPGARRLPVQIGVGVLMGLACITKNQIALVVLPGMLLAWVADLVWYKQRGWRMFVVPGIIAGLMFAGWTYLVLIALGKQGDLQANLATLRSATSGAFFQLRLSSLERAVRFLFDSGVFGMMLVPAVLYGVVLSLRRSEAGQRYGTVLLFILVALGMFMTSLAWPRYAFLALALAGFFVVRLVEDLTAGLRLDRQGWRAALSGEKAAIAALALAWAIAVYVLPLYSTASAVLRGGSASAYQLAQYLDANVPTDALIETWEQELAVLTDHTYHYPPQIVLAYAVAETWDGAPPAHELYDFHQQVNPQYVIVGEFGKYTNLYPPDRLQDYDLIHSVGAYDVYRRRN
ncbi:MAG: glycosyltransferase family 39 protein [Chloroflexi bacterium]|nr:glycosyltransferase family 39 protein [Chloroflexota bacterium]